MNRYYDKVSEIVGPYLKKVNDAEHGRGPALTFSEMVNLHAAFLGLAGQADRDIEDLLDLLETKQRIDDNLATLIAKLRMGSTS
jgi:hypothetical protein